MNIVSRHYTLSFLRAFLFIAIGLTALLTVISSLRGAGEFEYLNPGAVTMLKLALLDVPGNLVEVMPVSILVAVLLVVGHASGSLELVAVMASGGRLRSVMSPIVVSGVALCLLSFALSEAAVPRAAEAAMDIRSAVYGVKSRLRLAGGNIWLRADDGSLVRLGFYSFVGDFYGDISIYRVAGGRLLGVIKAQEARYEEGTGTWRLRSVRDYAPSTGKLEEYDSMSFPYLPEPSELTAGQRYSSRMGAFELMRYLGKLKTAGFRNPELSIELQQRFASPLLNLIMVLLGVGVAARRSLGALKAASIAIAVTAVYWLMTSMSAAMGLAGVIPPQAAAWISPAVFGLLSSFIYLKIPQ